MEPCATLALRRYWLITLSLSGKKSRNVTAKSGRTSQGLAAYEHGKSFGIIKRGDNEGLYVEGKVARVARLCCTCTGHGLFCSNTYRYTTLLLALNNTSQI